MAVERELAMQLPDAVPSKIAYVSDPAAIAQTFHDLIEAARSSIVLQMYLFTANGETEALRARPNAFPYARTVASWLIDRHRRNPEIDIVVLLDTQTLDDPAQTQRKSGPLIREVLEQAGIPVLNANLFRNAFDRGRRFPPVAGFHARYRDVSLDAWVRTQQRWQLLHNLEDHRKNLCIDAGAWGAVTSHNFWDVAFDWHENLFLVGPPAASALWEQTRTALRDALEIPQRLTPESRVRIAALAAMPEQRPTLVDADVARAPIATALQSFGDPSARPAASNANVEVLSGLDVRPRLLRALEQLAPGDRVHAASMYFSDLALLEAFLVAAARGVRVQVLVDDFAGLTFEGVLGWAVRTFVNFRCVERMRDAVPPNFELRVHGSRAGAMMHLKSAVFLGETAMLIGGQANYTPNSFSGAWLETNLVIHGTATTDAFLQQFTPLWEVSRPPRRRSNFASIALRAVLWLIERFFRF